MSTLKDDVDSLLRLSDQVLANPSISVAEHARRIHVTSGVASTIGAVGFVCGATATLIKKGWDAWDASIATAAGIAVGALVGGPIGLLIGGGIAIGAWIKYKREKERQRQEKERMLREIIKKQQALIEKLKKENAENKKEIENLQNMIDALEETIVTLRNAA